MNSCGLALLRDLTSPGLNSIFSDMNKYSTLFLREEIHWRPDLPWPRDAINQWSRQLEYPFAWWHLSRSIESGRKLLDAGSGLTFFPFYAAMHDWNVTCVDNDGRLRSAYSGLNASLPGRMGVGFYCADLAHLPFRDDTFSHACCISVLEHLPMNVAAQVLEELSRVILPGGVCIVTLDIALRADADAIFRLETFGDLPELLKQHDLIPMYPVRRIGSEEDMLTTVYFQHQEPHRLPWRAGDNASLSRRAKFWFRTSVLRRRTFEPLAVGLFVCRNGKVS